MAALAEATDPDALAHAHTHLTEQFGPVEVLAAFAGGNGAPRPTEQVGPEEWRRVIEGALTATFLTIRAALPAMIDQGRGAIVTMSSAAGRQPSQAAAAYAAAKAGVAMLSKHLAAEMGPRGIRVNCLAPSTVLNDKMATAMTDQQRDKLTTSFPLGRLGQPDDIAAAAVFLLSEHASWLTGVTLDISGGSSTNRSASAASPAMSSPTLGISPAGVRATVTLLDGGPSDHTELCLPAPWWQPRRTCVWRASTPGVAACSSP